MESRPDGARDGGEKRGQGLAVRTHSTNSINRCQVARCGVAIGASSAILPRDCALHMIE